MKKANLFLAAASVTVIFFSAMGCSDSERNNSPESVQTVTDTIVIENMQFVPSQITIQSGDEVVWVNKGIVGHNVTDAKSQSWTSGNIEPGSSWKMKPTENIQYFCTIHPTMKGSINLKE